MKRNIIKIMLIWSFFIGILGSSLCVNAQTPPPNEGNWIIDDHTTITDDSIVLNGDLIVQDGGVLELYNVDLKFNCESDGEFKLKVENGGEINVYNTMISSNTNYQYVIDVDKEGELNIINSTITDYTTSTFLSIEEEDIITILLITAVIAVPLIIVVISGYLITRKHRGMATTTIDSLVGKEGMVLETVSPNNFKGKVRVESRIWSATSENEIPKDEKVKVVGTKGINVVVERAEG